MEVITGVSARLERERRNERICVWHRAWSFTKKEDTHTSLGFENVDKKTLNSYTKKSEKKVEMKKLLLVSAFWHASLLEQKTHLAIIICLSLVTTR